MYFAQTNSNLDKIQEIYINRHGTQANIPYTLNTWNNFAAPHDGLIQIAAYSGANGTWMSLQNNTTMEAYANRLDNTNQYNPCVLTIHTKKDDSISYFIDGVVVHFVEFYQ